MQSIVTVGTFDGVHRGHQQILRKACLLAKKNHATPLAITFAQPPRFFFHPSSNPYLLTTLEEKKALLKHYGIQEILVPDFNARFSKLTAKVFFDKFILHQAHAKALVVGYDFRFGSDRLGDIAFLKEMGRKHGLPIFVVPPFCDRRQQPISSGRVRHHLLRGELEKANHLLGYAYGVIGQVVRGSGLGKQLGFPTANLVVHPSKILPPGVFAVRVEWLQKGQRTKSWVGMCNIGVRPTVSHRVSDKKSMEVHLFGFSGTLYGRTLKVELDCKLRCEKRFKSLEALQQQLRRDQKNAILYFDKND